MKTKQHIRLLSLLLALLFLVPLFPAVRLQAAALVKGDVSGDGKVTAEDARLCLRRAVGLETYAKGSAKYNACDYDGDGNVTSADARLILRAAVGLKDDTPQQQKFKVPMVVYDGKNGTITLTGYQTKYDSERQEMVLLCTFSLFNKSAVPYDPSIEGVTVNGLQISESEIFGDQLHPNSKVTMQVLIPSRYFDISQAGNAVVDELLLRFDFWDVAAREWLFADVALYPSNKTPGPAVRYAADSVDYKKSFDKNGCLFGFQGAEYHWRTDNDGKHVDYVDAVYYFKNNTGHGVYLEFYNIVINDSIEFENDIELFVFAGTAVEPEIYIDPNFFAWTDVADIYKLNYDFEIYDDVTGELLYSDNRAVTWN